MATKQRSKFPPIQPQQLRELATMVTSGLPVADAWAKSSVMQHPAGPVILRQLQKGSSVPSALQYMGLISAPQQVYVAAANNAGNLHKALLQLASEQEDREEHRRKLTSKFYVIYLLLFVGWGAGLALAAAASPANLVSIALRNTLWCLLCLAVIQLTLSTVLKEGWWWLNKAWRFNLQQHRAYQWLMITRWYALLSQQLEAGVDVASALRQMEKLLIGKSYRRAVVSAARSTEAGTSLSQALDEQGLMPNAEIRSILVSAEASGRIAEMLEHQRILAERYLQIYQDNVMFWVPKGLYGLCGAVALVMVL